MSKHDKYISNDDAVELLLNSPQARAEYDRLESRYAIISRIVGARIAKGWTQADLAQAVGRHKQSITRLESGTQDPRLSTLIVVCQALDLPLADNIPRHRRRRKQGVVTTDGCTPGISTPNVALCHSPDAPQCGTCPRKYVKFDATTCFGWPGGLTMPS